MNTTNKKIGIGDLRTPVSFFEYVPHEGPEPGEDEKKRLFKCTALAYNPSVKDMTILDAKGTSEAMTIKIRDPHTSYIPNNKHKVEVDDYRCKDSAGKLKVWEIVDIAPDYEDNRFIKLILKATS